MMNYNNSIKLNSMIYIINKVLSIKINRMRAQLILCLLFCSTLIQAQQDVMYSQYIYNMINVNPAYAGNRTVHNITALYRKQWVNMEGAPTVASISWDYRKDGSNVGYGIQLNTDKLGIENTTGFQAFYSYRIPFQRSSLTFGVNGGVTSYQANFLTGTDPDNGGGIDPSFREDVSALFPTVGVGALFATNNWYIGFSAPTLLDTKVYNNDHQVVSLAGNRYFLTGGYIFDVSPVLKLKPSLMLKSYSGTAMHFDVNLNAWINNTVGLGVSYRSNDAFVGMFQLQLNHGITIGYAYDYLTSNLKTYSKGSHELMLRFEFSPKKAQYIQSPRYY
jgi:type IX secretion system PorP/SprF family membrane protein